MKSTSKTLRVIDFQNTHKESVKNFLAELKVRSESGYAIFGIRENPYIQSVVLEEGNTFLGFGSIWKKEFHSLPLYISTYTREDESSAPRLELLYKSFCEIRDKNFQGLKFQTAYPLHLKKHLAFYSEKNFEKVLETYTKTLPVSILNSNIVLQKPDGFSIESFAESELFRNHKDSVLIMLIQNYKLCHLHNPAKEESLEFWHNHFLAEDVLLGDSYLLTKEKAVIGLLLTRKTEQGSAFFEIVTLNIDTEKTPLVVNILLAEFLINFKMKKAFKNIDFELDINSTNLEIINQLGLESVFEDSDKTITLQEK
jgi:hypothetical protein